MTNYFAIFGLEPSATDAEIKEAYRRLAKKYHPDVTGDSSDGSSEGPDASAMRRLNEAKAVLFDPKLRVEHRDLLGFYQRLAEAYVESRARPDRPPLTDLLSSTRSRPIAPPGWSIRQKRKFYFVVSLAGVLLIAFFVSYATLMPSPKPLPPIAQILDRHPDSTWAADDASLDTIQTSDLPIPGLIVEAEILSHIGDHRTATKYWKTVLDADSSDERAAVQLASSYFHRGRYARGIQILQQHVETDSTLAHAYFDLGGIFIHDEKPFDAESAFQEVLLIGERMKRQGQPTPYANLARERLKDLE